MPHERRVHAPVAIELLFEGKNDQRLVDVITQKPHSPLAPCPELRRDIVDRRYATLLHLAGHAPIERGRVDHDGEIRLATVGLADQMLVAVENLRQVAEYFRDADNGEIFGVDDRVASSR